MSNAAPPPPHPERDPSLSDEERQAFEALTSGLDLTPPRTQQVRDRARSLSAPTKANLISAGAVCIAALGATFATFTVSAVAAAVFWLVAVVAAAMAVRVAGPMVRGTLHRLALRRQARMEALVAELNRRRQERGK
jgi:fatty acid desaturase